MILVVAITLLAIYIPPLLNLKANLNIPKPSPIDCELGPWNDCNATCGTGMQSRIIEQEALYGGKECSTNRTIECNLGPCPIDCKLGPWNECNATCGTGMQSRFIVQEALYGGKECSTNRTSECNSGPCPIDCELSSWSNCDATCGKGMQSRFIVHKAFYGGKECSKNRTSECNSGPCPTDHVTPSSGILDFQLCKLTLLKRMSRAKLGKVVLL